MSSDDASMDGRRSYLIPTLVVGGIVGFLVLFMALGRSTGPTKGPNKSSNAEENSLETAQAAVLRETDLNACRAATQQFNAYLSRESSQNWAMPSADQFARLSKAFGLDAGERAEMDNSRFTLLDAHHLEMCFLLRDAARSLDLKGLGRGADGKPVRPTALDQATLAFQWVMRQVRLQEGVETLSPQFVLRRGWGSAMERALTFLALLDQMGWNDEPAVEMLGCLVFCPGKDTGILRLWACGVVFDRKPEIYLFDPRLGLPIPGPEGGVATLAQVRKNPGLLEQFNTEKAERYDVTAEQAQAAEVFLARSLSSLAPRLRLMQDQLLSATNRAHLASDGLQDLETLQSAVSNQMGKETPAPVWKEATSVLRRFLPPEEGGIDQPRQVPLSTLAGYAMADDRMAAVMTRYQRFQLQLAPWSAFPEFFRSSPYNIGLGQRLRELFARPFVNLVMGPGSPRDLVLRGRFTKAAPDLVEEHDRCRQMMKRRAISEDLLPAVVEWSQKATAAYANQLRQEKDAQKNPQGLAIANREVEDVWKKAGPIMVLLEGSLAPVHGANVTYLLGLCKHEQAERLQARLDLLARTPGASINPVDAEKSRTAWQDAQSWWKEYIEKYPTQPGRASALLMLARTQAMLGNLPSAIALLEDTSGPMTPMEKLGHLYLARQLKKI
jgi:hypothetical protein